MRNPAPEGYLGTDGRITSGPHAALVAAGYALELADSALLHDGLFVADLAHVIGLVEGCLIPGNVAAELLTALLDMGKVPADEFPYDVRLGDAYNSREAELARRVGDTAGWVHLGRTRREAGRIAFRLGTRELLLDLADALGDLLVALTDRARQASQVVWADSTYLQPAQPSTFGHYLASFAEETARHLPRLMAAYGWVDISPAGSGGVAGTRLGLDRELLARLLGFAEVGRNTRDTMWNVDGLIDVVCASTQAAITADRLAEDLQIFSTPGFDFVHIDAALCRASVLLPQKRNPYALAVVRAGASTLIGRLTGLLASARTPSAQTDNWLHAYGEVSSSLVLATRLTTLMAVTIDTLSIHETALASSATDPQVAATDLADEIVITCGLDYRTAYRVVGRAVARTLDEGGSITRATLDEAATAITGEPLRPCTARDLDISSTMDVALLIRSRRESGGCSPDSLAAELSALAGTIAQARAWSGDRRRANAQSRNHLVARAEQVTRQ
jgi:argininosuccinate lyase